jgi:hypothetical protein
MVIYSVFPASARSLAPEPTSHLKYQQHHIYKSDPTVYRVLGLTEVSHVHLQNIAHHIVEHEEASRLLDAAPLVLP